MAPNNKDSTASLLAGCLPSLNSSNAPAVNSQLSNMPRSLSLYSFDMDYAANTIYADE
jgi:hypothetical protein